MIKAVNEYAKSFRLILHLLAITAVGGCSDVNLKIADNRYWVNHSGEQILDIKIDKEGFSNLEKSGEALYVRIMECGKPKESGSTYYLITRKPVMVEDDGIWVRFLVDIPEAPRAKRMCGSVSSAGYSIKGYRSDVFVLNINR